MRLGTVAGILLALLVSSALYAETAGAIAGTVRDATGGALAGAQLTARHLETGLTRTSRSGEDGRFMFAAVPVGAYELRVELAGFRPLVRRGVSLTVDETVVVHLQMEVGPLDQEVTVTAEASLVNTQSPELSYLVGEAAIRELPLNGRNYTDLALLQPGVVAFPLRDGGSVVAHGLGVSTNGQDPRSNTYLLDGTPLNDFTNGPAGSAAGTVPGIETIREFRVETNAYSAEFGRNSGGQINVVSKSGTNALHGSLYEFHRNDNFDARNFFDPHQQPQFRRNQFGGSAGGPVQRDRTFFFFDYEALRERLGKTISSIVPDLASRQGAVDRVVRPYLDAFPLPNGGDLGGGLAAYRFLFNQRVTQNYVQGRMDHNFSPRLQSFLRYTFDDADQELPTDYPQFPRNFISRNQFVTAEARHVVSAHVLNSVRAGFSRTRVGQDVRASVPSEMQPFIPGRSMMGDIDIGGFPRFGPQSSVNVKLVQNVLGFEDNLVYTRGRHDLRIGGLAEHYQDNMYNPTFGLGIFTFASLREFLQNRPQRFVGIAPGGMLDRYWRFTLFGAYVQDAVRVHARLTLNFGLRYETTTQPRDIYGRDSALITLSDPAPRVGQLYRNPSHKNISPRFGFAWDPFGGGKTSLRGGYGIYFHTNLQDSLIPTVTNPPATPRIIIANPTFPVPPFERGVGNSIRPIEWNLKNPNVHVWNLNLQRQVGAETLVTLGYAGSRGVHLLRSGDVNIPTPQRLSDGTLVFPAGVPRPNPAFSTIELKRSDGNSWYNALLFEVRRRWSRGLSFQSSYTFARNIDTTQGATFFSDATNGTISAMPEFPGFSYNKGLADYHAKHNWVGNVTWELPFAKGMRGAARWLARGWQASVISQVRSGNPLTAFVSGNRSRSQWAPSLAPGIGVDRPSMAPGRTHASAVLGGPDRYLDPSAFVLQPAGTQGNLGRGALIGPNLRTFDFSLVKNHRWRERADVQFRAEAFNLFNRANFSTPNLTVFAGAADNEQPLSSFGRIRSTVTSSRQIQLGLRISF
jgi:hypothetical protein